MSVAREDAGLSWRKSSRSTGNGACVEIAEISNAVLLRDSKDPDGAVLRFGVDRWRAFIDSVRAGAFDPPGGN